MARYLQPTSAICSLERIGWKQMGLCGTRRLAWKFRRPDGQARRVGFQGRETSSSRDYLFGIHFEEILNLDDFVLWAMHESKMLVLPTTFLASIFRRSIAKIDSHSRWHVNVYFDRKGDVELVPSHYKERFDVGKYAKQFDRA